MTPGHRSVPKTLTPPLQMETVGEPRWVGRSRELMTLGMKLGPPAARGQQTGFANRGEGAGLAQQGRRASGLW